MSAPAIASRLADEFDQAGIAYAIGGALALGVWGAPRNTIDVDISAFVEPGALDSLFDSLERVGAIFERERAAAEIERIGLCRVRVGKTPVDVFVSNHPHFDSIKARRKAVSDPAGVQRWFLSVEDLIVLKLFYGRPKDQLDLQRLVSVQADIDFEYVGGWLRKMIPADDRRHRLLEELEDS